ncbi:MAG: pseudouridine synthase [Bacteroidota bacterium]
MREPLQILYEDAYFVAVHKPPGLLVHRSNISEDRTFLVQRLRDQIKARVYIVHRLDRPTAGVVLFGRDSESANAAAAVFRARETEKTYLAVVRGHLPAEGRIERALKKEGKGVLQEAVTHYECLAQQTLDIPVGPYPTARYSLVRIRPETGRWHQIRRHFNGISFPIVGDIKHGDRAHNRLFAAEFDAHILQLLARRLSFVHPFTDKRLDITAPLEPQMQAILDSFGWQFPPGV